MFIVSYQTWVHLIVLVWCAVHLYFSKFTECMITSFRQRAAHGSWVCCRRSSWATIRWRQVSSNLLCPIYFIIHCPAYDDQPKDWLALYLTCPWLPFGLLWLALCYCFNLINEHDVTIDDTMMLSRWWSCDTLGDSGHFVSWVPLRKDLFREWQPGITVQPRGWNVMHLAD
jgi:hypothetical protein